MGSITKILPGSIGRDRQYTKGEINMSINQAISSNLSKQKLTVKTVNNEWVYITSYHNDMLSKLDNSVKHIIKSNEAHIMETYLQPISIKRIDEHTFQSFNSHEYVDNKVYNIINKLTVTYRRLIHRANFENFQIRIEAGDNIYVIKYLNSVDVEPTKPIHLFHFLEYDNKNSVVISRNLNFHDHGNRIPLIDESWVHGYFYSENLSDARRYAKALIKDYSNEVMKIVKIMTYAFKTFMDDIMNEFDAPVHIPIEMALFRKFIGINRYTSIDDLKLINIKRCVNSDSPCKKEYISYQDDESAGLFSYKKSVETVSQILTFRDCPIVDLNSKEYDFIYKFCFDNGYIRYEDGKDITGFDITEFLKHPRYGSILKINPDFVSDTDWDYENNKLLTIGYEMDIDNDQLSMHIIYEDETFVIDEVFNFTDLQNFTIKHGMYDYRIDVYLHPNHLPRTPNEVFEAAPTVLTDIECMIGLLYDIIMIYIVTYLRPKRTKMVRITEHKPRLHPHSENIKDDDVIITHILKTTTDARNYIKTMREKTGCTVNREYVIEEWHRRGHFRRLKNGNTVYVSSSTCHRNQPLTGKEVHIKL